jgi:histidine ammonia-lyase
MDIFKYGIDTLTVKDALALTKGNIIGLLDGQARQKIQQAADYTGDIANSNMAAYGINTGFGILSKNIVSQEDVTALQHKLLLSHSVGVGQPIPKEIAKIMLIAKVQSLAQGYSGVQLNTLERILWHIDQDIIPLVPEKGSVGASGDLAPLSHLFLPLIGRGQVYYHGRAVPMQEVLQKEKMEPLQLGPKEGLALINGTQFIVSFAVKCLQRMHNCLEAADIIGALSLDALQGSRSPFDPRLHALRPFAGNQLVAHRLRFLLDNSAMIHDPAKTVRVQDPYSLRCMPQVHGASRNAWLHLKQLTEIELNAVTDNPIIFGVDDVVCGGNFHGQSLALPLDYCCVAAAELGNISDRRCYLLLEGKFGLPMLLMNGTGLNSGFMIHQYTTAALVTENKTLCFPASADSIPTSLGQEDHVSMGSISGRKLAQIIDNLEYILAIELTAACQAMELRRPLKSSAVLETAHEYVRQHVSFAKEDRLFADDINAIHRIIADFSFVEKVQQHYKLNEGYPDFDL